MLRDALPPALLRHPFTRGRWRLDLAYPELEIAIEYDGAAHLKQRSADERRRRGLESLGWRVLVFHATDVFLRPRQTVADIAAVRAERLAALAR